MGNADTNGATHEGFHHLTLNVQDVAGSERWYHDVLGFERFAGYETDSFARVIVVHPPTGAVLGLNRHTAAVADAPFDERRAGLDQLAFGVGGRAALDAWVERVRRPWRSSLRSQSRGHSRRSLLVTFPRPRRRPARGLHGRRVAF